MENTYLKQKIALLNKKMEAIWMQDKNIRPSTLQRSALEGSM